MKPSIKKPFSKRRMEYWKELDGITRCRYGAKLIDYVESGLQEGKPMTYIASELSTSCSRLCELVKALGIRIKGRYNPEEIKRELEHIEDIINLDIKDSSCLSYRNFTNWKAIESRVKQDYGAPSLPAYLLYEHQFNSQAILNLSSKLGVKFNTLKRAMIQLGIPLKDYRGRKWKDYSQKRNILIKKYWQDDLTLRQIAKEEDVSAQAVLNWMKELGIPRKIRSKTLEKLSKCLIN